MKNRLIVFAAFFLSVLILFIEMKWSELAVLSGNL